MKLTGLVRANLAPLKRQQQLLLTFASHFVDQLMVESSDDAQIISHYLPHADILLSQPPINKIDYLFSDSPNAYQQAAKFGAKFIPFDIHGDILDQCKTRKPRQQQLPRICLFGAESTGKTTLARKLAKHFDTVWVPEYARELYESKGSVNADDVLDVICAQQAMEQTLMGYAKQFLICDTDPLLSSVWCDWLFDGCPTSVLETLTVCDYYLYTDTDVAWQVDPARCLAKRRDAFAQACIDRLQQYGCEFTKISGLGEPRVMNAMVAITKRIASDKNFQ